VRRSALILATAALLASASACGGSSGGSADSASPIKIGQIVSLTGNYSALGTENQKSVALAVDQLNGAGGLLGRKVEVIVKDDKSQPDQSVLAFNDLKGEKVAAIIGSPFSNSALATIPLVDRERIPYLSLTPADEQVSPVHDYVFVVPATSATYADRILQYLQASNLGKIAVAYDTKSSYATAGFKGMRAKAAMYGVTLVAEEQFQTTTTEFGAVFTHVKSSGAEALAVWATGAPAVALTKGYATADLNIPLVLTGAQASKLFLQPAGTAAEGVIVASSIGIVGDYLPAGPQKDAVTALTNAFTAKYGYAPPQFAQDGYSAVKLLSAAVATAGSVDHEKIRAALSRLTLLTPNGTYAYSATDHAGLGGEFISVNAVKGGAFVPTDWAKTQLAGVTGK
jgi:branched-chain amino acid transport system substrate-binding protein